MDYTSRMVALMDVVRKEMNGAALDSLRYYGADYGLNYGAPIPALRAIARSMGCDDGFARFLYRQQVRELRIVALWTADPSKTAPADFGFWAEGIVNSEVAEQAAQALLSRIADIGALMAQWCGEGGELLAYAALLAASRSTKVTAEQACDAVRCAVARFGDSHLVVQGGCALLAAVATDTASRAIVHSLLAELPDCPTTTALRDEMSWRLEY